MRIGTPVTFTRKNGQAATGKFAGTESARNGVWAKVKLEGSTPKNPVIAKVRASQLQAAG